jgi:hypothetical protein
MAIRDQELMFSDLQALTATALSTNVVDLGPLSGGNTVRDLVGEEPLYLVITVGTVLDSAGEAATLTVTLESDDVEAMNTSPTVHYTSGTITEATLAAGYTLTVPVPSGSYQRYLALRYTVGTENFTSGTISATIQRRARMYLYYAAAGATAIS